MEEKKTQQSSHEKGSEVSAPSSDLQKDSPSSGESLKKSRDKKIPILKTHLEELEKKAHQADFYLDHLQRLQAEFENFRKRNVKEKEDFRKFLLEDFILELLDISDNFERAVASSQTTQDVQNLLLGFRMIQRQFQDCLLKKGVSSIEALDQPFDPSKHEAVSFEEREGTPPHTVIEQMTKGYALHGKVIRPSKVKVSKEPPSQEGPNQTGPGTGPQTE